MLEIELLEVDLHLDEVVFIGDVVKDVKGNFRRHGSQSRLLTFKNSSK